MLSCVGPYSLPYFKKLFSTLERMDGVLQRHLSRIYRRDSHDRFSDTAKRQVRLERVSVEGDVLSYLPEDAERVGVYVAADALNPESNYVEIEILDGGVTGNITIGLVSHKHPLDQHPGFVPESVGYNAFNGSLYKGAPKGLLFGPKCETGDRMGCGIKFNHMQPQDNQKPFMIVFFTKNGKEVGTLVYPWLPGGLFPAISLHSPGEEVRLSLNMKWLPEEDMPMCIDSNEDDWSRLHDIRLNGTLLEYAGRGKSIIDVGLAQARFPLNTTCHYFEIEIIDPGENCYIAIGLARRDYPKYRHPGWNKGSVAYHADDGKVFVGSGVGEPFGPRCYKGDVMGCGIIFPSDYVSNYDSDDSRELTPSPNDELDVAYEGSHSDSEDEDWWKEKDNVENGSMVQVFFTRNGKTIGQKDVCIPKGGFYPTVGMLSSEEKVKVDLHPLTG